MSKKVENGILEFNAKGFIIPNAITKISKFISADSKFEYMKSLMKETAPDMDLTMDDELLQLWFVSSDLNVDNLCRHSSEITLENGREVSFRPSEIEDLPVKIFADKKEGDIIDIIFNYNAKDCLFTKTEDFSFKVVMHLQLAQTEFRYRNFGKFEECFQRLSVHTIQKATNSCEASYMES